MDVELEETLKIILDHYNERTQGSVFILMHDFPWYNERNGQLGRLYAEGMIAKPRYSSDGAEILLTQKGRHYFDEPVRSVPLDKKEIYRILTALQTNMKMPDDCFGYERREANGVLKYLQEEGLITGTVIAMGGAHKPPLHIRLEDARITLKGLQFLEDYERAEAEPMAIDLSREFLSACAKIADDPASYASFDEDGLNRLIRNFLEAALNHFGYSIADQTQQGLSGTKPGEIDIRISKGGIPIAIYEGLIHRNRKYLYDHIDKAIGKYNISGCGAVYMVEYSRNKGFGGFWDNACEALGEYDRVDVEEVNTGLLGVRMLKGTYDWEDRKGDFYYIGVNCCGN